MGRVVVALVCIAMAACGSGFPEPESARELADLLQCADFDSTVNRGGHSAGTCDLDGDEVFLAVFGRAGSSAQLAVGTVAVSFACEFGGSGGYLGGTDRVLVAARSQAAADHLIEVTGYDVEAATC